MSNRTEAKLKAKTAMHGMVFRLWFATLLVSLPVTIVSTVGSFVESYFMTVLSYSQYSYVVGAISTAVSLLSLGATLLTIPLNVGMQRKFLRVARGGRSRDVSLTDAFKTKDIAEPIKGYLLSGLYIFLGTLLFIIPGIVIAMKYSMLTLVFADNPGIDFRSAMKKCKEITKGRKGKIFGFYLSFIGWYILVGLTGGILSIYVIPYEGTALAALYDMWAPKQPSARNDGAVYYEDLFPTVNYSQRRNEQIYF